MNPAKLQAVLDKRVSGNIFSVAAGIQSKDGRLNFIGASGKADLTTGQPMTPDTPYYLASIAKMYTTAVIVNLHDRGNLSLDEPISKYLPAALTRGIHVYKGTDYSEKIKVYQLVNQTSGLSDYFAGEPAGGQSVFSQLKNGQDVKLSLGYVTDLARQIPPKFEPGAKGETRAYYSDTNYQLLGAIIEAVTGKSVAENFQQFIFSPLELKDTYLYDESLVQIRKKPAAIFTKNQALNIPQYFSTSLTDGGVVSTVNENLSFLRAFFEGGLFDPKYLDRMMGRWNPLFFPLQYGYGMMRFTLPRFLSPFQAVPVYFGHSGASGSFAYYCPEKALYLAGTVNQVAGPNIPIQLMIKLTNLATS
jgi:CubicO group peptidase (beta-lactamase class C family)